MGSTPAFLPCLLIFNEVMRRWLDRGIHVSLVHAHVMRLHERFLKGLDELAQDEGDFAPSRAQGGISAASLHCLPVAQLASRSHTLVFDQSSPAHAKAVVDTLKREHRIELDSRKTHVRVGFGFNHHPEDVDR